MKHLLWVCSVFLDKWRICYKESNKRKTNLASKKNKLILGWNRSFSTIIQRLYSKKNRKQCIKASLMSLWYLSLCLLCRVFIHTMLLYVSKNGSGFINIWWSLQDSTSDFCRRNNLMRASFIFLSSSPKYLFTHLLPFLLGSFIYLKNYIRNCNFLDKLYLIKKIIIFIKFNLRLQVSK